MNTDLLQPTAGKKAWANPELSVISRNLLKGGGSKNRLNEQTIYTLSFTYTLQIHYRTPANHGGKTRTILPNTPGRHFSQYEVTHS